VGLRRLRGDHHGRDPEDRPRLDRLVGACRAEPGLTLLVAHGHILRVLAARWLGLGPEAGRLFRLDTATVSVLGWERENPVVLSWNLRAGP
jgi:probable phosphoglycerate mutase